MTEFEAGKKILKEAEFRKSDSNHNLASGFEKWGKSEEFSEISM